jgi:hypothetical protein
MTALHVPRPGPRRARVAVPVAEPEPPQYPAGHFTALMRRHDWPPRFEPMYQRTREVVQSEISRINRERRVAMGDTGTIVGLTDRADELIRQRLVAQRAVR